MRKSWSGRSLRYGRSRVGVRVRVRVRRAGRDAA